MATLVTTHRELFRYRGREGQLAWIGHRLAGLRTLLFFTMHVVDTSWVYFAPDLYEEAIKLYKWPPFLAGEMLLMLAVIYHAYNGLRIAIMDMRPRTWKMQRQLTLGVFVLTALTYAPVFFIMMGHIIDIMAGK